jgi:hypothetical protein
MADRRPAGWNQWAEVVGRNLREPRFIGDMPHGWIASDFASAALDLFAYERQGDRSLVLAAGIPTKWLAGKGIAVENLRTPDGKLSYGLQRKGRRVMLTVDGGLTPPAGGLVFGWRHAGSPGQARIGADHRLTWKNGEVRIKDTPASLTVGIPSTEAK